MAIRFGVKSYVYTVREIIFIFMYLIIPLITYFLQCYLASQENDKQRFIIKYGRLPEVFVALIIGLDALKSNDVPYNFLSVKMTKVLCVVIAVASFTVSFIDLFDYVRVRL